ncbi:MAG: hypothetical protein H6737_06325 [Alphaproteobacteria bacterium]|nr:hypothetical protein [Alphaproteobacteria bacterium]
MHLDLFFGTLHSSDPVAAAKRLERFLLQGGLEWQRIRDGVKDFPQTPDWIERSVELPHGVMAFRENPERRLHTYHHPLVDFSWYPDGYSLDAFFDLLSEVPFDVLQAHAPVRSMDSPWREVPRVGGIDYGGDIGWALFFQGGGHHCLPSRRWLTHGPWLHRQGPGDISMIQLCDWEAAPEVQVAQAHAGRSLFGGLDGAYSIFRSPRPAPTQQGERPRRWSLPGEYDAAQRLWRGPLPTIDKLTLSRLISWKAEHHHDPWEPVDTFALELQPDVAQAHLHVLWLCGFQVWVPEGAGWVRIDTDYDPEPDPPVWVREVLGREAARR